MFSKKAKTIEDIFTVDLTFCKISSILVAFLENTNFTFDLQI